MLRFVIGIAVVCLLGANSFAADTIKIDLDDFKLTPDAKGTDDLLTNLDGKLSFYVNGTATAKVTIPADGEYTIVISASCMEALKEKARFTLKVGNTTVKEKFELTSEDEKEYKFPAKLTKGATTLSIQYTNDVYKANEYDRNLFIHAVKLEKK